jgi:hypothetical protein
MGPRGIEEFGDSRAHLHGTSQFMEFRPGEVGKDAFVNIGEDVVEIGGVSSDRHALCPVVVNQPVC